MFTQEEAEHWLSPREGVFYNYVVMKNPKDEDDDEITDFLSFYELNT